MGLFNKTKKEASTTAPKKKKQKGFGRHKSLMERMDLNAIVPSMGLQLIQDLINQDQAGAIIDLNNAYFAIAITNDALEESGVTAKDESFGQFAHAIQEEEIKSFTLDSDLTTGVLVLLPDTNSLEALEEFSFLDQVPFHIAIILKTIQEGEQVDVYEETVSFKDLEDIRDGHLTVVYDRTANAYKVKAIENDNQKNASLIDEELQEEHADDLDDSVDLLSDDESHQLFDDGFDSDDATKDEAPVNDTSHDSNKSTDTSTFQPVDQGPLDLSGDVEPLQLEQSKPVDTSQIGSVKAEDVTYKDLGQEIIEKPHDSKFDTQLIDHQYEETYDASQRNDWVGMKTPDWTDEKASEFYGDDSEEPLIPPKDNKDPLFNDFQEVDLSKEGLKEDSKEGSKEDSKESPKEDSKEGSNESSNDPFEFTSDPIMKDDAPETTKEDDFFLKAPKEEEVYHISQEQEKIERVPDDEQLIRKLEEDSAVSPLNLTVNYQLFRTLFAHLDDQKTILFDETLKGDTSMDETLQRMRHQANVDLLAERKHHYDQLYETYTSTMQELNLELAKKLDPSNPKSAFHKEQLYLEGAKKALYKDNEGKIQAKKKKIEEDYRKRLEAELRQEMLAVKKRFEDQHQAKLLEDLKQVAGQVLAESDSELRAGHEILNQNVKDTAKHLSNKLAISTLRRLQLLADQWAEKERQMYHDQADRMNQYLEKQHLYHENNYRLKEEKERMSRQIERLEDRLHETRREKERILDRAEQDSRQELRQLEQRYQREMDNLRQDYDQQLRQAQYQTDEARQNATRLQTANDNLRDDMTALNQKVEARYKNQLADKDQDYHELEGKYQQLQQSYQDVKEQNHVLQKKVTEPEMLREVKNNTITTKTLIMTLVLSIVLSAIVFGLTGSYITRSVYINNQTPMQTRHISSNS